MNKKDYINQPKLREDNLKREQYRVSIHVLSQNNINLQGKKVLDFGAGNGEFSEYLKSKGALVDSQELNENSNKILRKKGLNVVENIKENSYDYIFALEVIEHFVDPTEMISMLKKGLCDDGKIFITTPDHLFWKLRIKYFLGDISAFEYPNKHFAFFSEKSLKKLMNKSFKQIIFQKVESKLVYVGKINP